MHLWERLSEAVFEPIGIHHMTMIHVPDEQTGPGIPLLASGLRLTVDDLSKIVTLLQNGGVHEGRQLLHPTLLEEALYRTGEIEGLPSGKSFADGDQAYHMSFWALPYRSERGDYFQVLFMSGAAGNTVFLAQNGVSTVVLTDHGSDVYSLKALVVAPHSPPSPSRSPGVSGGHQITGCVTVCTFRRREPDRSERMRWLGLVAAVLIVAGVAHVLRERRARKQLSTSAFVFHTLAAAVVVAAGIQLVPAGRSHANPAVTGEPQWADPQARELMVRACYGCHSNEVDWPWYSSVAPVSWAISDHVSAGRDAVNDSEFNRPQEEAGETIEVLLDGSMPPANYTRFGLHPDANLSAAEVDALVLWLRQTPGLADEDGESEGDDEDHDEHDQDDDDD